MAVQANIFLAMLTPKDFFSQMHMLPTFVLEKNPRNMASLKDTYVWPNNIKK